MPASLLNHIRQHISIDVTEQDILFSKLRERKYLKNQYILQNGDVCSSISFVIEGAVRVFHIDSGGKEHVMMLGVENWWIGDLSSFITQSASDYNIQCVEATKVIQLQYQDHANLMEEVPQMNKYFRVIIENAYVAVQQRIVRNFSLSAKERYIIFSEKYPDHMNRFPQYMIASYLGITKEFLSKIRSQSR